MRTVDPVKHEEKRREILSAAERCFVRKGFQSASISDICAEAKISPGRLYHYFPSKESIVAAIVGLKLESSMAWFTTIMAEPDPVAAFVAEVGWLRDPRKTDWQALFLDILAEAGRNPVMADILKEHQGQRQAFLAEFIRAGQARGQIDPTLDPEAAADILLSMFVGSRVLILRDSKIDMEKRISALQTAVIRFLTPKEF